MTCQPRQNLFVQKYQRFHGLVLRGGSHLAFGGQITQKHLDLGLGILELGGSFDKPMKLYELLEPLAVGPLGIQ